MRLRFEVVVRGMEYAYRQLIVWQMAMELVQAVYALLETFPAEERYALCDQIRRAVVSIPSNIAEGNGRSSPSDYAHFLAVARGSLFEVMTQLEIASILGYISSSTLTTPILQSQPKSQPQLLSQPQPSTSTSIESLAAEIRRMLNTMISKFGGHK